MNQLLVDQIVNAVLYEGYILYPYRPSVKNKQRWTFGGLCPRSYSEAHGGSEAWTMRTECLVRGSATTAIQVEVRFLHLTARLVGELNPLRNELPDGEEPAYRLVERLQVGDRLLLAWQEAEERRVSLDELDLLSLAVQSRRREFDFPAHRRLEPVRGPTGEIVAVVVREQQPVTGVLIVSAEQVAEELFKVSVWIENQTPLEDAGNRDRDEALLRSLVSTHTVLAAHNGEFVSLIDPPEEWRELVASCRNVGAWPVLVGNAGEKDTMLSSPIILYDYPQIAPESPGDLFDSTEIDEILTLRILTLTDEEKQAAVAVDGRVRALLHRSETLDPEQMRRMHGTVRGLHPVSSEDLR